MRRVQEWERSHSGKEKGEGKWKNKSRNEKDGKFNKKEISFNLEGCEEKLKMESERRKGGLKLRNSQEEIAGINIKISEDEEGRINKLKAYQKSRSRRRSESSLEIPYLYNFNESFSDRKSMSIDVLCMEYTK